MKSSPIWFGLFLARLLLYALALVLLCARIGLLPVNERQVRAMVKQECLR